MISFLISSWPFATEYSILNYCIFSVYKLPCQIYKSSQFSLYEKSSVPYERLTARLEPNDVACAGEATSTFLFNVIVGFFGSVRIDPPLSSQKESKNSRIVEEKFGMKAEIFGCWLVDLNKSSFFNSDVALLSVEIRLLFYSQFLCFMFIIREENEYFFKTF